MKKKLAIIATIGFGLDLLLRKIIPVLYMLRPTGRVEEWAMPFRMNFLSITFDMFIPVAGLCLSIACLLPDKKSQIVPPPVQSPITGK